MLRPTEMQRKNLMETCLEAHARRHFKGSGFESAEWSNIEKTFNIISGINANKQQLQKRLAKLKGFHTKHGYIVNQMIGFVIDPDKGLITTSDK